MCEIGAMQSKAPSNGVILFFVGSLNYIHVRPQLLFYFRTKIQRNFTQLQDRGRIIFLHLSEKRKAISSRDVIVAKWLPAGQAVRASNGVISLNVGSSK